MAVEAVIFQQIVDINWDQAIYTASPNNTVNVAQFAAKGSGANIGVALSPKGTGYISAQVPDGTTVGGNARGANSVDLQSTSRGLATQVASGASSVAMGSRNTASGQYAVGIGFANTASAIGAIALGEGCIASGQYSVAEGFGCTASGDSAVALGVSSQATGIAAHATGSRAISHLTYMRAHGGFGLSVVGGSQEIALVLAGKTTTNAEVILEMFSGLSPVLKAGSVWSLMLHIVGSKSDGSAVARYHRQVTIKRVVNTTSLVGSAVAIGTDEAAGTSLSITADDANDRLSVGVTGITGETWRWVAVCHGVEMLIGA